ncbi:SDR family oxidoreductase [Roseofilum reptotaenium CS-1145]|uniref:3-beta hydroxysteroid dehydrogenase n=1 Tax=Roseofilum reptotaenium AO1-A TaxID=1925591 RepID=A0A1L9QL65_9CYAN|nr:MULTISPECIES: SDR family oxidoreductase [Roseofilum]MBP0029683.1 SDR family oxidoreductase [Roseofilum sp. Guam]MDB9517166.1 SDR family oxidoreductase [Roseofilum reptotaenium CS-1145]OJJ18431.1 3-beta hydroxysteroid dehydrogenase [Roseofilum reptotaenium AO1-A]
MTLLIVGATGTLGRQITFRALEEGHSVRCLVRNYQKAGFLKERGAELAPGNLCQPDSIKEALQGVTAVIDASTSRPTDSLSMKEVDWEAKVSLIQAVKEAGIERYIFFSILDADQYPQVPLMAIKHCTELFLKQAELNYTIFQLAGFMQGLIPQYAIPILDQQGVWVMGKSSPVAYMDTQDIAQFAVRALSVPETEGRTFPLVGPKAWSGDEIIALCERLSGRQARVSRMPIALLRGVRRIAQFFQWTWNISDRLAFAEVQASGKPLSAPMDEVYTVFGLDPKDITTLDSYMQEYFSRILKKLKEVEYEREKMKQKSKKRRSPFKSRS